MSQTQEYTRFRVKLPLVFFFFEILGFSKGSEYTTQKIEVYSPRFFSGRRGGHNLVGDLWKLVFDVEHPGGMLHGEMSGKPGIFQCREPLVFYYVDVPYSKISSSIFCFFFGGIYSFRFQEDML